MKLESIKVKNIRSIEDLNLDFPISTILFFGDVGSGKSSVLKAIEFGLFGTLGDLPADSILRRGQNRGFVELKFNIDNQIYTIYRSLKRVIREGTERVKQTGGWVIVDGVKKEYTTTDLRLLILNLLNYSTSRYKAHNKKCIDIYRYTVYTPQEEIKAILEAEPAERFDILKDVLEIEKYENTLRNLDKVRKKINRDLKNIEAIQAQIGNPEEEIPEKKKQIESHTVLVSNTQKEITKVQNDLDKSKKEQELIQNEYKKYSEQLTLYKAKIGMIQENNSTIKDNENLIQTLTVELSKKQEELDSLPEIKLETEMTQNQVEKELADLRVKEKKELKKKTTMEKDIFEIEELLKNNKCPRCKQEIHEKERFDKELTGIKEELNQVVLVLTGITKEIIRNEKNLKNIQEYERNEDIKKNFTEIISEMNNRKNDLSKTILTLKNNSEQAQKDLDYILNTYKKESLQELEVYEVEIKDNLEYQKAVAENIQIELTEFEKNKTAYETELKTFKRQLEDLLEEVRLKEKLKEKSVYLRSISEWVSDQLPVLIRDIERTILSQTASYFDIYFKEWFRVLVQEENIEIRIAPENLQPIVHIDGHESPFRDMSGGEKSALSLAYRLALNKVINTIHQDVKTKDLLILDEPTDGFSEAQVSKMQQVFDSLNMKQMIVISHERTLDSFVTDIFSFKKSDHKTKVTREKV